ncbi:MAG TPA: pitrilysin family protein [Oligoflexus sp.]|uniref:M16 family metallopeptidase n=1 Tax=Oligoflexus sp. TaxID=1971216 RepID=UPI002D59FE82|nr:pitrilysin family protein [Oligoflexus sp.]HYX31990.1 pitrilysin family protein [Oligoflexus sp.]
MLRKRLENGIDVVIQENQFSKMFALQCWIGVGSLHEEEGEEGISHCIEHMLFKGTKRFAVGEISRRVEFLGGEMNAYTSFEHTVFYLTLPAVHAAEAIDILADSIFNSSFDPDELGREKEVILEELKRNEDSPGYMLGRKVFSSIYEGTPASKPIIGYEKTIKNYSRETIFAFMKKWYQPDNMKVVAVGAVKADALMGDIQKAFGSATGKAKDRTLKLKLPAIKSPQVHVVKGDFEQPRIEIAFPAPDLLHEDLLPLDLAAFALGSGESSRLHRRVRDEQQLTSVVGASVYAPSFGGVFELSAMPHADSYLECVTALGTELARLKYEEPVTREELERARANAKADRIYSEETVSGQARSLGNALQTPHDLLHDYVVEAQINRLNTYEVEQAVHRWLREDACVMACILPKDSKLGAEDVRKAFLSGFKAPASAAGAGAKKEENPIHVVKLTPQVTFIYKQQNHNDLMNLTAVCSGGLRCETPAQAGMYHILADLLGSATATHNYADMLRRLEGQGAVLGGFSGKDTIGVKFQCLSEQVEDLLPLWAEAILDPRFPDMQLQTSQMEVFDNIQAEKDSPSALAMRRFQQAVYGKHPYAKPVWGSEETVKSFNCDALLEEFNAIRDRSHWIISGVGRLPFEPMARMIERLLQPLHKSVDRPQDLVQQLPAELKAQVSNLRKDREQVHLVMGTLGLNWNDKDRYALDVLSNVLGGSGGRFFVKLRDEQSLAYSVSPLHSYGCHRGIFGAYMACTPHKLKDAETGIRNVWDDICQNGVGQDEIDRSRNYLIGGHESDMQRGDSQAMSMALMELYGRGYDDFETYANRLHEVDRTAVQNVARRLLNSQEQIVVRVGPVSESPS